MSKTQNNKLHLPSKELSYENWPPIESKFFYFGKKYANEDFFSKDGWPEDEKKVWKFVWDLLIRIHKKHA